MNPKNTVLIRCNIFDFNGDDHPQNFYKRLTKKALKTRWVSQPLGEQIWLIYEFANIADKQEFIASLSPRLEKCYESDEEKLAKILGLYQVI